MNWPLQKDCDAFYGNPRGVNGQAQVFGISGVTNPIISLDGVSYT